MKKLVIAIKTYREIIIAVLIIVVGIIGFFVGVYPATTRVLAQWGELQSLEEEVAKLKTKSTTLDGLDEGALRDQLSVALSAVPSDKSVPTVFSTMERAAEQTGVTILDLNVSGGFGLATNSATRETAVEARVGTRIIPGAVTVEGSLESVQQFVSLIPTVRRLLRIRSFSITYKADSQPLTVRIQFDAFYAPFPTTLGSATSQLSILTEAETKQLELLRQFPLLGIAGVSPEPSIGRVKDNPFSP